MYCFDEMPNNAGIMDSDTILIDAYRNRGDQNAFAELVQRVSMAEAALRLQKLETDLAKAELDLALAHRQLEQRRIGR